MSKILFKNALVVAVAAGLSAQAFAVEPQSIRLTDGVIFTPTLKVSETHDDNFRATEKNKKSTWITTIAPSFQLNADSNKSAYQLKYTASSDTFHSSHSDNNVDHFFSGDAGFEFNSRNRLRLNAGYKKIEETASADQKIENDKFNTKNVGGVYTFGAEAARTQVEFGANYDELRYDNSTRIAGKRLNSDKERDATALRSTVFYEVAPKTKVLLEGRYTDYDYKSFTARDSKNKGLLAGVTWDATAKTSGTFKIGREKKDFKKSTYSDKTTGMWEAGVTWAPLTYSTFNLNTRRGFDEGEDNASAIKSQNTRLGWKHDWMERLYSEVSYARSDRKYQEISRTDKRDDYGVSLTYQARRWLDVGVGYTYADNDSNAKDQSYKRNIYALTVSASL